MGLSKAGAYKSKNLKIYKFLLSRLLKRMNPLDV